MQNQGFPVFVPGGRVDAPQSPVARLQQRRRYPSSHQPVPHSWFFLLLAAGFLAQPPANQPPNLPAAPLPASASAPVDPGSTAFQKRKWVQSVDPGERVPRLSSHDKMVFWLHEEARVESTFPAFISAGYGQLVDDAPHYGTDSGTFGKRLSAALVRQASFRFFSSSLFPEIYREDPRYYRKAHGSIVSRGVWAAERVLVTRRDSGAESVNGSLLLGHLAASALTPVYYPARDRTAHVVFETWGISLAGAAGNNLFLEFWPSVLHRWQEHREREHARARSSGP